MPYTGTELKFKLHGRNYLAVEYDKARHRHRCCTCTFVNDPEGCSNSPHCSTFHREDQKEVIFIRENL